MGDDDRNLGDRDLGDVKDDIDEGAAPSGTGCAECLAAGGWWVHLRRCARCGHIGCCNTSPAQHATAHYRQTGHRYVRSFEPGESWYWDYATGSFTRGPSLAPPQHRPEDQPVPGPEGAVPADWRRYVHR
jgi:hypothetical protein